jgi:predicted ATPase/class 3 adenylate cyclase
MAEFPSGTVTFLFTDLEVSTRLWDQEPQGMRAALARHDVIVRDAIAGNGGHVVKGRGDGVHAVFATADAALCAAVEGQRAITGERWPVSEPLRVRMGLHTGVAELRDGDYFGSSVNRAARLMGVAHGGQIVVSEATADLTRDDLGDGVELVDLGEHRLRDLSRPERVFQVNAPGLESTFAPLRALDAFPGNLPLQVSSFIGRDRELVRVAKALEDARVVTLTGVGGVGKTRLAVQVAAELLPRFREGAWLVELAAVRDPDDVVGACAAVFGVTARVGQTLEQTLVEFLRTKQLLLIVDNCEHLLAAVAELVQTVERSCAGVTVLATSREGLGVEGERMLVVPSLEVAGHATDLDSIAAADAVRLFVARSTAAKADFVLTEHNAEAVVQVCRHLDGVPLAIELAAARIPAMSPRVLLSRLDQRFRVLSSGRRGAVERHQTLQAAIDWSYDLCSEPEQRMLARLTVFSGGCTLEAAEAVCAGEGIETGDVFELVAALVAQSLVVADDTDSGDVRYRLLETIRQYGEERLGELDEYDLLRGRHAEYFCEFASAVSDRLFGPDQVAAGRQFGAEHENLLAALNYGIETDNADLALRLVRDMPDPALQIGYALRLPLDRVFGLTGVSDHPLYLYALTHRAGYVESTSLRDAALAASERLDTGAQPLIEVRIGWLNATALMAVGAHREAATSLERSGRIAESAGGLGEAAYALGYAAFEYMIAGDVAAAKRVATDGLALARQIGVPGAIGTNLNGLAGALVDEDREQARALLLEGVQVRSRLGYETAVETLQTALLSARLELWTEALEFGSSAIRLYHWINDWMILGALCNLVARAIAATDAESAAVLQGVAYRFATSAARAGEAASGSVPNAEARQEATPADTVGLITQLRRTTTAMLIGTLGDDRLRELRNEGQAMDADRAIAYTLEAVSRARRRPQQTDTATLAQPT